MSVARRLTYIGLTLVGAVFVLIYRGPGWPFIRSYMGDWLIVQFLFLVGRFAIGFRRRYFLAGSILLLGIFTEIFQLVTAGSISHSFIQEITIGSTFDPVDIIAYVLGLTTVLIVENYQSSHRSPGERS